MSCLNVSRTGSHVGTSPYGELIGRHHLVPLAMRKIENTVLGAASVKSASNVESTQWTRMSAARANGWAAEDWNALVDKLCGKHVDKVGLSNELNGADRIVNGIKIQTKYCRSAYDSVYKAFDKATGRLRYPGMKLEVPKGQGEDAIRYFAERIRRGDVPGVTDPAKAREIIVEGHCTYDQAVKVAKAGNVESLKYDVLSHAVTCTCVIGLTFVLTYTGCRMMGLDPKNAFKSAYKRALVTGATYLTVNVAIQQFFRTQPGRDTLAWVTKGARKAVETAYQSNLGRKAITQVASREVGKQASEQAIKGAATKIVRGNVITATAMTVAVTVPDIVRSCQGKQSWKETGKNAIVNTAGTAGGWGGAAAGAVLGTAICPGIGTTIGGILGGLGVGIGVQAGVKKLVDWVNT